MKRPEIGGPLPPRSAADIHAEIRSSKRELRRWARAVRMQARAEIGAALDDAVCEAIRTAPSFRSAKTVAIYIATPTEIDLAALRRAPDKRFLAPRTHKSPEPHLTFHDLSSAKLELHPFGMLEPSADSAVVPLVEVDLVCVPGLAFDQRGGRLGYGGGYYDRLLSGRPNLVTIGVTLERLLLEELPVHEHDVHVMELATERGWRPVRPA